MKRAVVLLAVLGTLSVPGLSEARPPAPPTDYRLAYTEVHSKATRTYGPVRATSDRSSLAGPRSSWCDDVHTWYRGYSAARVWLWTLHQSSHWCHSGYGPNPGPRVVMLDPQGNPPRTENWWTLPAWSPWDPDLGFLKRNAGAVGTPHVWRWRQGKIKFCAGPLPVCQTKLPWIAHDLFGDGSHNSDAGM